jgi:hypothetical protein
VEVPLHLITIHPPDEDEFYEEPIYSRNKVCWRIRDGIRAVKNPPRPRPVKVTTKPVAKPAAEPEPVKRVTKAKQPTTAKEMAGVVSVRLGPKKVAKKRTKKAKTAKKADDAK